MVIDCKGDMPDDKQFYGLDMGWKEYYLQTKKVVFKEGIKSIGAGAFEKFQNLESIVFPRKLCIIKNWAFSGCIKLNKIKRISFYKNDRSECFFSNTALRKFSLKNIRRMKNNCLSSSKLVEISIPANCKIGSFAFWDCKN